MTTTETPTQAARRLCPAWQTPHGTAHYLAVLKALTDQRAAAPLPVPETPDPAHKRPPHD